MSLKRPIKIPREHSPKIVIRKLNNKNDVSIKESRIDTYLQRMAHLTQVALLILGVLGYIFTVKPAFQNQILQEEASRLELEKRQLKTDISKYQETATQLSEKKMFLEDELRSKSNELSKLHSQIEQAKSDAINAQNKASIAEKSLSIELKKLNIARWEIIKPELNTSYLLAIYNLSIQQKAELKTESDNEFITQLLKNWISPSKIISTMITDSSKRNSDAHRIPEAYYKTLLSHIVEYPSKYYCKKPNATELKESYNQYITEQKKLYKTASNVHLEKAMENDILYKTRTEYNIKINEMVMDCMLFSINETLSFIDSKIANDK